MAGPRPYPGPRARRARPHGEQRREQVQRADRVGAGASRAWNGSATSAGSGAEDPPRARKRAWPSRARKFQMPDRMSEVERLDETFATDPERDLDAWLEQMSDCEIRIRSAAS